MIPLGDSKYQIENFIASEPPSRRARTILLQLDKKYGALKECEFRRRTSEIQKQQFTEQFNSSVGYNRELYQIEIEKIDYQLEHEKKLIDDALEEVRIYTELLDELPQYTREEFEALEEQYWHDRFLNDARCEYISTGTVSVGTIQALEKIGIDVRRKDGQLQISQGTTLIEWNT